MLKYTNLFPVIMSIDTTVQETEKTPEKPSIRDAFEDGFDKARFPDSMIWMAYGHASLNAVGSPEAKELRDEANQFMKDSQNRKNEYGILCKIAYYLGYACGWA